MANPTPAAELDPLQSFSSRSLHSAPAMCAAEDVVLLAGKLHAAPSRRAEIIPHEGLRWREISAAAQGSGPRAKAEYRRLRRATESDDTEEVPPRAAGQRPKWQYFCVLGAVGVPATMEISDIRRRQRRQSAEPAERRRAQPGRGSSTTWKLLRSLSCIGADHSALTPSSSLAAHVRGA
ncbi:hypothetical protein Cni_G08697 [Canna indica]|uniref:Uncharacterized protein n=1 Tax=Canna indica TaxID=4628 RepID=A0AAQ3Q848_9LILI|nr:hypothetical protein Cni_G08697 [Canna indica]